MTAVPRHWVTLVYKRLFLQTDHANGTGNGTCFSVGSGLTAGEPRSAGVPPRWCDAHGEPVVSYGFRSTFRDWAEDTGTFAGRLAEAALAHMVRDKTEAAYQRGDLFMRRVRMMAPWSALCDRFTGTAPPEVARLAKRRGRDAASARA